MDTSININKPLLDTNSQIDHLIFKGVKFNYMSEDDARRYLEENNNYFRIRSYRKNFSKYSDGENIDKYIDLDFAMLVDLSVIDMRLRYVLLKLVLDVEHFSKVLLLTKVASVNEDGYQIVKDYFSYLSEIDQSNASSGKDRLLNELNRNRNNPYCGGIINKYDGNYPIWAFIEVIPMGSFIHFFQFCAERLLDTQLCDIVFLLKTIKDLRNAAAHSNCILYDMTAQDSIHRPNYNMIQALSSIPKATRSKKLNNERTRQITTLLYTHNLIVTSDGVHKRAMNDLYDIVCRMYRNIEYYKGNEVIISNFNFFKKVIDILYF